jgi:DNA invertase Pin-like site-specific DNA recombinase
MKTVTYLRTSRKYQDIQCRIDVLRKYESFKNIDVVELFNYKTSGFHKEFKHRDSGTSIPQYIESSNIIVSELSRISCALNK